MSLNFNTVIAAAPSTVRGQPYSLGSFKKQNSIVYGNGLIAYARNIESPGQVKSVHRHKHPVTMARVSPSQCYCASGDKEGNVIVWALDNEQNTVKLETRVTTGPITDICWTGDNERIIIVGEGKDSFGAALLVNGGSTVGSIGGHTRNVMSCDVRLERPFRAATCSEDTEVNYYEGPPYKFKASHKHHTNTVNCVRFSPSGESFLSVSSDKQIFKYDGKTGEKTGQITCDHTGSVYSVAWHPSGKQFITASADKSVKLWDAEGEKVIKTFKLQGTSVEYMQLGVVFVNERMVSVGFNGDVNIFSADKEQPETVLRGHQKPITSLAVSGNTVVTCSNDPAVLIWEDQAHSPAKSKRPTAKKMHGSNIGGSVIHGGKLYTCSLDDTIAVTPLDSAELTMIGKVSGGPNGICVMSDHLIVTTNKGIYVLTLSGEEKSKVSTTYTPSCCATNGKILVVGTKAKIVLYSFEGGNLKQIEEIADQHKVQVTALAFNKDGKTFASGDSGREILMWEYDSKVKMISGPGDMAYHTAGIKSLSFNPSGTHLASGSVDTNVMTWEVSNVNNRAKAQGAHLGGVNCVGWLSDKEVISCGQDCCIRTYNLA